MADPLKRRDLEVGPARVAAYGHYGRPLLVFPSELGHRWDFESNGMLDAMAPLVQAGRVKVYCVDAGDAWTWRADNQPLEERARRHGEYERWITDSVAPWIHADSGGDIIVAGASFGAYHAANFALKRADLFPLAICMSGVYDVTVVGWGEPGDAVYFNNPIDYTRHLHGDHLDWLCSRVSLLLLCGQGQCYDESGERLMHLQAAVEDFDVFARSLFDRRRAARLHRHVDLPRARARGDARALPRARRRVVERSELKDQG